MSIHPTYGGPRKDLDIKKDGCPCCAGRAVISARLDLCDYCWNKTVRMMACHTRKPLPF